MPPGNKPWKETVGGGGGRGSDEVPGRVGLLPQEHCINKQ